MLPKKIVSENGGAPKIVSQGCLGYLYKKKDNLKEESVTGTEGVFKTSNLKNLLQ